MVHRRTNPGSLGRGWRNFFKQVRVNMRRRRIVGTRQGTRRTGDGFRKTRHRQLRAGDGGWSSLRNPGSLVGGLWDFFIPVRLNIQVRRIVLGRRRTHLASHGLGKTRRRRKIVLTGGRTHLASRGLRKTRYRPLRDGGRGWIILQVGFPRQKGRESFGRHGRCSLGQQCVWETAPTMAEKERNLVHAGRKVGGTGYSIDQLRLNIGGKHETAYNQTVM